MMRKGGFCNVIGGAAGGDGAISSSNSSNVGIGGGKRGEECEL